MISNLAYTCKDFYISIYIRSKLIYLSSQDTIDLYIRGFFI